MSSKSKSLIAILIIAVVAGGTSPYVKLVVNIIPPNVYTFIRFFLSFIVILPIFLGTKPKFKKDNLNLFWLSLLSTVNIILFAYGIKLTTASTGQVIYSFQPIVVVIISYLLLKEKISIKKIIGILVGFTGINLVVAQPFFNQIFNREAFMGNLMILLGCIIYSYYVVYSKKFLTRYSPLWLATTFIFTTTIVSLFFSLNDFRVTGTWINYLSLNIIWAIVYVVLIGTVMAYFLQQYAIKHGSPLILSLVQFLSPGSTMIWSYFILGEQIKLALVIGTIITLYGAWLVTREY